jgi:hypothetical protein
VSEYSILGVDWNTVVRKILHQIIAGITAMCVRHDEYAVLDEKQYM